MKKESLSTSMPKLILVVSLIVSIGALLGTLGYVLTKPKLAVQNPPIVQEKDETADWQTYRNEKYGFEFKYPKVLNSYGFKAVEEESSVEFTLSTKEPKLGGHTSIFSIIIMEKDDWNKCDDCQFIVRLGEKNNYIFAYSHWQDYPDDVNEIMLNLNIDAEKILSTFKFIEKDETNNQNSSNNNPIISIPFHNSNKILQVYGPEPSSDICDSADEPYCIAKGLSVFDTTLSLTVYNTKDKSSVFIGRIQMHYGANAGGLFVPYAITKDDSKIILEAHMGDPGAGGGMIDYGYAMIPIKPLASNANPIIIGQDTDIVNYPYEYPDARSASTLSIAPHSAKFYDLFGKIVYVDEGDKTPHFPMPGPSNNGAIIFRNLVSDEVNKLLEEKDTSYEIVEVDEKNKILKFKSLRYIFPEDCPREADDALYCAEQSSATERAITLP